MLLGLTAQAKIFKIKMSWQRFCENVVKQIKEASRNCTLVVLYCKRKTYNVPPKPYFFMNFNHLNRLCPSQLYLSLL